MGVSTAFSTAREPDTCARELRRLAGDSKPAFVLFFASTSVEPEALGAALRREFGEVASLGCTTAGEITSGRMLKDSVVLMAFDSDSVQAAHVRAIDNVDDGDSIRSCLDALTGAFGMSSAAADPQHYFGLVLHDGLSLAEEAVMARLGELTNLPFVGGSAGDDLKFETTTVFANFRPLHGTSVLAIVRPNGPYSILKSQSFRVLDKVLEATDVETAKRTVKAFDGHPAAERYAAALGMSVEQAAKSTRKHPLGIVLPNGEPFVRAVQRFRGQDLVLYCRIEEGTRVHLLEATDIVGQTRRDLQAAVDALGGCSALVNFHCIERTLELEAKGQVEDYAQLFSDIPSIGFSTYGESYIGHINQTSTMLLLR